MNGMSDEELREINGALIGKLAELFKRPQGMTWGEVEIVADAALRAVRDAERAGAALDTMRLDWLEQQGDGSSWVARQSNTGRGFRLHNTGEDSSGWHLARSNPRAAIDVAMRAAMSATKGGRNGQV